MPPRPDAAAADSGTESLFDKLATALVLDGYAVLDNVLPAGHLALLSQRIVQLDAQSVLQPAATGRGEGRRMNDAVRSDSIRWLQSDDAVDKLWLDFAEQLRQGLNERLFLGLFDCEAHYARYAPGAFYARHRDAFVGQRNRLVSSVLYLNDAWQDDDGGELLLFDEAGEEVIETVLPQGNRLVVFLSERVPHEVRAASRPRYSVAGWFRVRN